MNNYICSNCEKEKARDYWIQCTYCATKCCDNCVEKLKCDCIECDKCFFNDNITKCTRCCYDVCKKCKIIKTNQKKRKSKCKVCKKFACKNCVSIVCCDCSFLMCFNCKNNGEKCKCYNSG
jgi:hypothetical protein